MMLWRAMTGLSREAMVLAVMVTLTVALLFGKLTTGKPTNPDTILMPIFQP